MMNPRSAIVFSGLALMLGVATLSGAAPSPVSTTETTPQDPDAKELRDQVIKVLTDMQEQNNFQHNVGLFFESIYSPRGGQGRVNQGTVYYQLPGKRRKDWDIGVRIATHVDDKRSLFTSQGHYDTTAQIEPVMASLLDITAMEPASWIRRARALGIDPDKFNEQEWDGKQYFVIGGDPDQLNVPQIWIEKETLRPARAIIFQRRGSERIFDYQVTGYATFEDGSIFMNGFEMFEGRYKVNRDEWSRFEINRETNDDFFDTDQIVEEIKMGGAAVAKPDKDDDDD